MGRDLLIVNPDKRQYISEHSYACSAKSSSYMHGLTANAVALLICKPTDLQNDPYGELAGSWFGDRVIAAGDDHCLPNQDRIVTATPEAPHRNLHAMAIEEFTNISHDVMLMMAKADACFAEQFARLAKDRSIDLFFVLARCAIEEDSEMLQQALESVNGGNWRAKYRRACDKYGTEEAN